MNAGRKLLCVAAAVVLGLCVVSQGWAQFQQTDYTLVYNPQTGDIQVSTTLGQPMTSVELLSQAALFRAPLPGFVFTVATPSRLFTLRTDGVHHLDLGPVYPVAYTGGLAADLDLAVNGEPIPDSNVTWFEAVIPAPEVVIKLDPYTGGWTVVANKAVVGMELTSASGSFENWDTELSDGTPIAGDPHKVSFVGDITGGGFTGDVISGGFTGDIIGGGFIEDVDIFVLFADGSNTDTYELFTMPHPVEVVAAMRNLTDDTSWVNLANGLANSLDAKLVSARKALDNVNTANDVAACNKLNAFINAVEAQRGNKITDEDADYLIAWAEEILIILGCP